MPCQRVTEKGKSSVIFQHAVHMYDALLVSVLRYLLTLGWWAGLGVMPRNVTPLQMIYSVFG